MVLIPKHNLTLMEETIRERNILDVLRLEDYKTKVEFLALLHQRGLSLVKGPSPKNSLANVAQSQILLEHTKEYLRHQEKVTLLLDLIDGKRLHAHKDYDIGQDRLFFLYGLQSWQWDQSFKESFSHWITKTADKAWSEPVTGRQWHQLLKVCSFKDILLILQKDLLCHREHKPGFLSSWQNFHTMIEKKNAVESFLFSWKARFYYELSRLIGMKVPNLHTLRKDWSNAYQQSQVSFVKSLLETLRRDVTSFKNILQNKSLKSWFSQIESFKELFLSLWELTLDDCQDFDKVWGVHSLLLTLESDSNPRNERILAESVIKHMSLQGKMTRQIYTLYYQSLFSTNSKDDEMAILGQVFTNLEQDFDAIFKELSLSHKISVDSLNAQEFCHWMIRNEKKITPKIWDNLYLYFKVKRHHEHFIDLCIQYNIFSLLTFRLQEENLDFAKKLTTKQQRKLSSTFAKNLDISFVKNIHLTLFSQGEMSQDEFQYTYRDAIHFPDLSLTSHAFEIYESLPVEQLSVEFAYVTKNLLSITSPSKLTQTQRLVASIPFKMEDFTGPNLLNFLNWYKACDESHREKAYSILLLSLADLFTRPERLSTHQCDLIEGLLKHLVQTDPANPVVFDKKTWNYYNELCHNFALVQDDHQMLHYLSSVDFSQVAEIPLQLRERLVDLIEKHHADSSLNLKSTIMEWILRPTDLHNAKLLFSPKQFVADLLAKGSLEKSLPNPLYIDYLQKVLNDEDKNQLVAYALQHKKEDTSTLAFMYNLLHNPTQSKNSFKLRPHYNEIDVNAPMLCSKNEFEQLSKLEDYLLKKIHQYLPHFSLLSDLYEQASIMIVKGKYFDDEAFDVLALQIRQHPFDGQLNYQNSEKLAQNIFLAAWVYDLKQKVIANDQSGYEDSLNKLQQREKSFKSKTARQYIKNIKKIRPLNNSSSIAG